MIRARWLLLATLGCGPALAATWTIDRAQSQVGFTSTWEGVPYEGVFHRYAADIEFDPAAPQRSRLSATVDVTSVDSRNADRDAGMAEPEFLDFVHHPTASFESSAVRALGGDRFEVDGVLTVKGIERQVTVGFTWTPVGGGALLQGGTTIQRLDFDIGGGEWAAVGEVGVEVTVSVRLMLVPD